MTVGSLSIKTHTYTPKPCGSNSHNHKELKGFKHVNKDSGFSPSSPGDFETSNPCSVEAQVSPGQGNGQVQGSSPLQGPHSPFSAIPSPPRCLTHVITYQTRAPLSLPPCPCCSHHTQSTLQGCLTERKESLRSQVSPEFGSGLLQRPWARDGLHSHL